MNRLFLRTVVLLTIFVSTNARSVDFFIAPNATLGLNSVYVVDNHTVFQVRESREPLTMVVIYPHRRAVIYCTPNKANWCHVSGVPIQMHIQSKDGMVGVFSSLLQTKKQGAKVKTIRSFE